MQIAGQLQYRVNQERTIGIVYNEKGTSLLLRVLGEGGNKVLDEVRKNIIFELVFWSCIWTQYRQICDCRGWKASQYA